MIYGTPQWGGECPPDAPSTREAEEELECVQDEVRAAANRMDDCDSTRLRHLAEILEEQAGHLRRLATHLEDLGL